jgi:hypothetical protein
MAPTTPKDDSSSRVSDTALRKKKNADAQAAFRARRANYIATLEETVTNLEAVVLQLQDSCREARAEANELRQDNNRLRTAGREREKFWRALWQTKKGSESQVDEFPPPPACFGPMHPQITAINSQIGPAVGPYSEDTLHYSTGNTPPFSDVAYQTGAPSELATRSPSVSYAHGDNESHRSANHFTPYPSPPRNIIRDVWAPPIALTGSSGGDSGHAGSSSSSHSPTFVESPSVATADVPYLSRYSAHNFEDQKILPSALDSSSYLPTSRSHSPASTRPSSSSTSLTSPFQFPFNDGSTPHEKGDFDYRRHHPAEVTLQGGMADVSLLSHGLRIGARRGDSTAERPLFSSLPGSLKTNVILGDGSEIKSDVSHSKLRPRRTLAHAARSPSPGAPPLSGTLAVIKAQAFGALRRTRSRAKKGADSAAKVALEALEARGIGMGVSTGSKRARVDYDEEDAD